MSEEKLVPKLRFSGFDDEWTKINLGELSKIGKGFTPSTSNPSFWDGELYWLSIADMNQGKYIKQTSKKISLEGSKNKDPIEKGTLLMSFKLSLGKLGILTKDMYTNEAICNFKWKNNNISTEYMYYYLSSINIMKYGSQAAKGITLNNETLNTIPVILPNFDEQNKISNFLSKIDKKIELLEKKHQAYEDFKKYLMQQIFTQKLRFDFSEDWKIVKIKDIFDERSEKGFDELELLSVTLNEGVIKRSEIESKDNSNDNKSNYKHVLPNDMVYNSMRMWQGASGVSSYEGIVSPAYTILIPKNVHSPFFGYYFKTHEMIYQFKKYSQGLTSDTWNLKYPLISEIKLKIPSLEEQKQITNLFETIDIKIEILENIICDLKNFRKGLLQQMFV